MRLKTVLEMHCMVILLQVAFFLLPFPVEFYKINLLLIFAYTVVSIFYMRVPFYHPYILFLCSFFLFMLSRVLLDVLGGDDFAKNDSFLQCTFSLSTQFQTLLILSISLISMHFGAIFAFAKTRKCQNNTPKSYSKSIKKIALWLFYGMLVPYFFRILTIVLHIYNHGYVSTYMSDETIISNPILGISDDVCMMGFYLFLATFPSIKEMKIPGFIYISLLILSLGGGHRGQILTQIFALIAYFGLRGVVNRKRFVIVMVCMIVLAQFAFLFRGGAIPSFQSLRTYTNDFFHNQGVSLVVVEASVEEKENLKEVSILSPLLYIARNSVGAKLIGYKPPQGQSKEYALSSHGLGEILSYKFGKEVYLSGGGMGSALVSEFFLWAGYFGVFIGCLLFVYAIIYLFERYKYSTYGMFLLFYILPEFFFSPRNSPLLILNYIIRPVLFLVLLQLFLQYSRMSTSVKSINVQV
jgi:hypothetical protein